MLESRIFAGVVENCQNPEFQGNLMQTLFLHGPMMWKVMQRSVWKDIVSWRKNNAAITQSLDAML